MFENVNPHIGEYVLTYGVSYKDEPDNFKSQYLPFLIVGQDEEGNYLCLKSNSSIKGYSTEFILSKDKYPKINKDSALDLRIIYKLPKESFIRHICDIEENDLSAVIMLVIKSYAINNSQLSPEEVSIINKEYMKDRYIIPGCVIRVPYIKGYLLVTEVNDNSYKCLPLYRDKDDKHFRKLTIVRDDTYVDYKESIDIDKKEVFYIVKCTTHKKVMNYVFKQIEIFKENGLSLNLKKD